MESCSICFLPYTENNSSKVTRLKKELCCHHCLCESCYLRLEKAHCPFCRSSFQYTHEELIKRKSLNLEYDKWQPPSQITNYIPPEIVRRNNINSMNSGIIRNTQENNNQVTSEPYGRVRKNMSRRRRRDLSFEEVLERRRIIRKRCKLKWTKKNGRLEKESHYDHGTEIY